MKQFINEIMNQLIISFYTARTVFIQEELIFILSKAILILATVSALINVLFNCVLLVNKEVTNIKNILVSAAVIMWVYFVLTTNLVQKFTQEWIVETSVYDGYFVRSVELVIATVVLIRLFNYLVKQRNVILKEKELVVLELLKWPKSSIFNFDNDEQGPGLSDIPPEELEKMVAKINQKEMKKERTKLPKEKMKKFVKEGIKVSVMVLFYAVSGVFLLATLSGDYDLAMIACSLFFGVILLVMVVDSYFNRKKIKIKVIKKISKWSNTIKKEGKEFRKNSTSGESFIIWSIGAIKLIYIVLKLVLLYLYFYFGEKGLGIAWKKLSEYLVQSGMDPLKAESMKMNAVGLLYAIGYTLLFYTAMISCIHWMTRRDDFSFKYSVIVRTTKLLFKATVLILVIGVCFYIVSDPLFIDPESLTVTVLWAIIMLNVGMILNRFFLNVLVNRAQKVMFHEECKMDGQMISSKAAGIMAEHEPIESIVIDDERLLVSLKNYFLVREAWKSLIVLENTNYSKKDKESFWLVEKTYRFRYTFFKFTRGLHIRLSVLDSLDMENEVNSIKPGDSIFKEGAEEQLSKNIFISPQGTVTGSETLIDSLKKRGYEVRVLDITAPGDTYNPTEIIKYLERKEREEKQMEEELLQGEED
ncbi:hypothetical protein [Carnobacterium maltaromaticum]|uniref:hypothetical protein n=1 Tax=Carnobacterium maltaromaticum TaxID=2751 RepID=UPI0012FAC850|nr:hypothetical protein [Carnobacterium maltaromaticum]